MALAAESSTAMGLAAEVSCNIDTRWSVFAERWGKSETVVDGASGAALLARLGLLASAGFLVVRWVVCGSVAPQPHGQSLGHVCVGTAEG